MSEAEKQEGQKTVVAFITGLLIGGLLVWVFSSSPEEVLMESDDTVKVEEGILNDAKGNDVVISETKDTVAPATKVVATGKGAIKIADQASGDVVALGVLELPTEAGWVVVRDYMDGVPGNVLGAARFSTEEGLIPTQVQLLRNTTKDSSYQVVYFNESTDTQFSMKDDTLIEGIAATFKAN